MSAGTISVDDLAARVGQHIGTSKWFEITQERINAHADTTEDWQFIHVDPDRAAREAPFGGTIAHGFLTLSLLSAMSYDALPDFEGAVMGVNYGMNRMRFLSPVPTGSRVRGHFALKEIDRSRPGEVTVTWEASVEIEGHDKPALIAEWIGRRYINGYLGEQS